MAKAAGRKPRTGAVRKDEAKAWIITVDMGLGHQRAASPLAGFADGGLVTAGGAGFADEAEQKLWTRLRNSYETLSRIRSVPIIGRPLFGMLDRLQNIPSFYPIRDMSNPSYQVLLVKRYIDKGLGRGTTEIVRRKAIPAVSCHPVPALALDYAGFTRNYCIVTDAEISRAWVAVSPTESRIHYMAPCGRAVICTPSAANRSRFGVLAFEFPNAPRWSARKLSSMITMTLLGSQDPRSKG